MVQIVQCHVTGHLFSDKQRLGRRLKTGTSVICSCLLPRLRNLPTMRLQRNIRVQSIALFFHI
jgi:hypothetical protein